MPLFVFIGHDRPGAAELRQQQRPAHLEKLGALAEQGRVAHAGPLLDETGKPLGSVIVFEAGDLAEAKAMAASDPYVEAGLFERYTVNETKAVFSR